MAVLLWLPVLVPAVMGAVITWRHSAAFARLVPVGVAVVILVCGIALVAKGRSPRPGSCVPTRPPRTCCCASER